MVIGGAELGAAFESEVFEEVGNPCFAIGLIYSPHIGISNKRDHGGAAVSENDEFEAIVEGELGDIFDDLVEVGLDRGGETGSLGQADGGEGLPTEHGDQATSEESTTEQPLEHGDMW